MKGLFNELKENSLLRCLPDRRLDFTTNLSDWMKKEHEVIKTADGWRLNVLVPGYEKDELSVEIKGEYIIINGEKNEETDSSLFKKEISFSIYIGDFDGDNINAWLKNGVLTLDLPSSERKKITVKIK